MLEKCSFFSITNETRRVRDEPVMCVLYRKILHKLPSSDKLLLAAHNREFLLPYRLSKCRPIHQTQHTVHCYYFCWYLVGKFTHSDDRPYELSQQYPKVLEA